MNLKAQLYNTFDTESYHIRDFLIWLAQSYQLPPTPHLLDIGCGTGRLLEPMAAQSWQVTGFEPDAEYYSAAIERTSHNPAITVRQAAFSDLDQQENYHLIAAINAPFAYLLDLPSRQDALARMYRALHPQGILFLDIPNFLWILRYYRPPEESVYTNQDGTFRRVIRHDIDWHNSTLTHIDTFYRNERYLSTQVHRMAMMAPQTLFSLVEAAGFTAIRTYNSYADRQAAAIKKERILLSACKPL